MNLELTIIVSGLTFIVMLILLTNLYNKMRSVTTLLTVLIKKFNALEEKVKWDDEYIKTKLEKIDTKVKPEYNDINWKG